MDEKFILHAKKTSRSGWRCCHYECLTDFAQDGDTHEHNDEVNIENETIGIGEDIGAGEDRPGELAEKIHQDEERQESPEAGAADDGAAVFVAAFSGKSVEGEDDDEYDAADGVDVDEGDAVHQRVDGLVDR